jgi:hypothetical protein
MFVSSWQTFFETGLTPILFHTNHCDVKSVHTLMEEYILYILAVGIVAVVVV